MARRRKKKTQLVRDFIKLIFAIAVVGLILFYFKNKNESSKIKTPLPRSETSSKVESKPNESAPESASSKPEVGKDKVISNLFPAQAWQDDYLLLKTPLGKSDSQLYLVGIGLAPEGKKPDQINNPSKLKPYLMVVKKEENEFIKISTFDFQALQASEGGIPLKSLRGIPRIKSVDVLDFDNTGMPEIKVSFDTPSELAEAIGFLKWNGSELSWLKTKNKAGEEKIALWLSGASSADSQQIEVKKDGNSYEVIQKYGQGNPKHPEKGFEWKTTVWKMKEGMLQQN